MFGKKKKHVQIDQVRSLNDALKAIKSYIYLEQWTTVDSAIADITQKELDAFTELEYKIKDDFHELQKQRKIFEKNKRVILKLKKESEIKKIKYDRKIE
jgi:hypothetical protein